MIRAIPKKIFFIYFSILLVSCTANSQENPAEMFAELHEKYKETNIEKQTVDSNLNDGMGMYLFDADKKISDDIFCQVNMYATMGQTQYLIFKKAGESIWYFHKKVFFYEAPYELEDAEIQDTYFRYANGMPYAFNVATGKYDIQTDTNKYQAIVDVRSLTRLIEAVQNAIGKSSVKKRGIVYADGKGFEATREKQEEEKQEVVLNQEAPSQEMLDRKPQGQETDYASGYVFDIESFRFLDEFPWPISDISAMYPDEGFEEKTSTSGIKGLSWENWYSLESQDIAFDYLGKSIDEAILYVVEIFTPKYQCDTMQIIGMPVKDLEIISGYKPDPDKKINISNGLCVLSIATDGNTVKSYTVLREL